jgi:predicted dehydrogenase
MKALVIGYGSIGQRHVRLLNELGCKTAVISTRQIDYSPLYSKIEDGLAGHQPEYVVIANSTGEHYRAFAKLADLGYNGAVLVEKPLFHCMHETKPNKFMQTYVAYNLRFHPVIQRLKTLLAGQEIISVLAYVGQYLPDWRPQRDYRQSYSAMKDQGGGVLRDISHELDYLIWLLGGWNRLAALGGHFSPLKIDSEDTIALIMETPLCPAVSLQLNYLDRMTRRFIVVNTAEHTIEADLIGGTITLGCSTEKFNIEKNMTYRQMHQSILEGGCDTLCSFKEGVEVIRLIEAVEISIEQKRWVGK